MEVNYGEQAFKSGDFGLEYEERSEQSKNLENEELEALLDEDSSHTQKCSQSL